MHFSEQIFKTYDIRGKFPEQFSSEVVFYIGRAIGNFFGSEKNIVIGGDVRLSTPIIKTNLSEGLKSMGCNVLDVEVCTTPTIYFLAANNSLVNGGIMVTASHNPIEYNGIKVCNVYGVSYNINNFFIHIKKALEDYKSIGIDNKNYGQSISIQGINNYQYWLFQKENFKPRKELSIGVEIGNGTCYPIIDLLKEKKFIVRSLHSEPDGRFPVMIPDPAKPSSLIYLQKLFKEENFDIGIAFDVDGDRVGFIDNKGVIIKPDHIIMLFGEYLLNKYKKIEIMIDVKTSRATYEYLNELGVNVKFTKVGHSWIHEELLRTGASFAGELSGHYYFGKDYYGFDDAIYSALKMIELLSFREESSSEIIKALPHYFSSEELRIPCPDEYKSAVVSNIKTLLNENAKRIITIDGIRAEFDDGWVLVRKSGTEPVISIRAEATSSQRLNFYKDYIEELVKTHIEKLTKS